MLWLHRPYQSIVSLNQTTNLSSVSINIKTKIYTIRGVQVMLDRDLAELYQVETRVLNQAVKRNIERFPDNFMFQLTKQELENWIQKNIICNIQK